MTNTFTWVPCLIQLSKIFSLTFYNPIDLQISVYRSLREVSYSGDSFSSKYNYYDGTKHLNDYLYESTRDVLGNFKHFNLSAKTLNIRNMRSRSPLVTRELDRYFERKSNYLGDTSAGCSDFRHYNYRRTPYFGGSDDYSWVFLSFVEILWEVTDIFTKSYL